MTERHDTTTGARLVLRAVGVAFGSLLMFLLLAVLNGGGTAEASAQPAGLGDLLGGTGTAGSLLDPIVAPLDDVVAPILEPVTQPVTPVVTPVTDTVAPIVDTVVRPIVDIIAVPVNDTVAPIVEPIVDVVVPVVRPVVDIVAVPVEDTVAPIVATVIPQPTDPVPTDVDSPVPDGSAPAPQPASQPAVTPDTPTNADPGSAATVEDLVAIEAPTPAVGAVEAAPTFASSPRDAAPAVTTTDSATPAGILERVIVPTVGPADPTTSSPGAPAAVSARSSGPEFVRSIVTGLLSGVPSPSPTPGAPSTLLAVMTATVAALLLLSRRVTTEMSWRSALVFSSVERPG